MLAGILSRIALSPTFMYGSIGIWYVRSRLHMYSKGDILVNDEEKDGFKEKFVMQILDFKVELLEDCLDPRMNCTIGFYVVDRYSDGNRERIELSKRFVERGCKRGDFTSMEEAIAALS